jgi:CDP-diacylglycerol--serine O-phosphatidyltransferase
MVFTLLSADIQIYVAQSTISLVGNPLRYLNAAAFLIAAFSALRLAKFNTDERQTYSFIGLPTPANALFWGSLIWSLDWQRWFEPYLLPDFWLYIVLVLIPISSYLLVSEIPMFALKFKTWGWKGNEVKYIFLITCIPMLLLLGVSGLAAIIAWYVILSAVNSYMLN